MINKFEFIKLDLDGAFLIKPFCATDNRGKFIKDYSSEVFSQNGIEYKIEEVFYTTSHANVMRAIHFQIEKPQPKLVRCIKGKVFDVIIDLRKGSNTYGKWLSFILSEENMHEILIPEGFGHGYYVIEDAIFSYKCSEKFYGEYDTGIIWNDKDLEIKWPITDETKLIFSDKDLNLQSFEEFKKINKF